MRDGEPYHGADFRAEVIKPRRRAVLPTLILLASAVIVFLGYSHLFPEPPAWLSASKPIAVSAPPPSTGASTGSEGHADPTVIPVDNPVGGQVVNNPAVSTSDTTPTSPSSSFETAAQPSSTEPASTEPTSTEPTTTSELPTTASDRPQPSSPVGQDVDPDAVFALIDFDWQARLPGWSVNFVPRDGHIAGYTWTREKRIEVFVSPESTPESLARIFAHELGHAVDVEHNTPDERRRWLAAREAVDAPWWPTSGAADFQTGAGDFAEAAAYWISTREDFRSELAPEPDAEDLALLIELLFE